MTQEFAQEASKGTIIAGSGDLRRIFYVHKSALEKSSIIKGWIEEPGTIPSSLHKDSALCFPAVDPEVMETVVRYLERDEREQWAFDLRGKALEEVKAPVDHIFYVRLYKLALSLAVEGLCIAALDQIQGKKHSTEVFMDIVFEAEGGKVIDSKRFRNWVLSYIRQHAEQLNESKIFRKAIEGGGVKAWTLCSLLMKGLEDLDAGPMGKVKDEKGSEYLKGGLLSTPPSSSKRTSSFTRHGSSYSGVFHRSPTPSNSRPQATDKQPLERPKKRKHHATVEDATVSGDEKQDSPFPSETKLSPKRARQ